MTIEPALALVVEDEPLQRAALAHGLKLRGFDVVECESAEAAELLVCRIGPELSLLVTDFSLSGSLTGLDLAQFTRGRMPHVDVVIISGRPEVIAQDDFAFVAKPCMAADILRAVTAGRP